jgi:hypothetical protein
MRVALRVALFLGSAGACHPTASPSRATAVDGGATTCTGSHFTLDRALVDCAITANGPLDPLLEGKHDPNELRLQVGPGDRRVRAGGTLDIAVSYTHDRGGDADFVLYGTPHILAWDAAGRSTDVVPPGMEDVDGPCWSDIAGPGTVSAKAILRLADRGRVDATLHWRASRRTITVRTKGVGCEWVERPLEPGKYELRIEDLDPHPGHSSDPPIAVYVE